MRHFRTFIVAFITVINASAQELPVAQQYLHNLSYINPACIGREDCTNFYLTDRHQWVGIAKAPSTQVIGVEHTIVPNPYERNIKYGLGLQFLSDRNGAVHQNGGQVSYAFHARLNKNRNLFMSLGISASLIQHSVVESESNIGSDPAIGAGVSALLPDLSSGIYIYGPKFYTGFSILRMLPSTRVFYYLSDQVVLPGNYYFLAGYKIIPHTGSVMFNPMMVLKLDSHSHRQIDLNLIADFNHQFQAGISYRRNLDVLPGQSTGMQFLFTTFIKKFQLNYIAEISLNSTQTSHFGSHELGVIYRVCRHEKLCPAFD